MLEGVAGRAEKLWPGEHLWNLVWPHSWPAKYKTHVEFGACYRLGLPGEEAGTAASDQHVCPGAAAQPGPGLDSLGCCSRGLWPHPRAAEEAAGKSATGKAKGTGMG